jgi:hypothetical protein
MEICCIKTGSPGLPLHTSAVAQMPIGLYQLLLWSAVSRVCAVLCLQLCTKYFSGCCALLQVVMLYVDEDTSINRQLQRAVAAQAHNKRVVDAGLGEQQLHEERSTDVLPEKARKRYQIFRQHYSAILRCARSC